MLKNIYLILCLLFLTSVGFSQDVDYKYSAIFNAEDAGGTHPTFTLKLTQSQNGSSNAPNQFQSSYNSFVVANVPENSIGIDENGNVFVITNVSAQQLDAEFDQFVNVQATRLNSGTNQTGANTTGPTGKIIISTPSGDCNLLSTVPENIAGASPKLIAYLENYNVQLMQQCIEKSRDISQQIVGDSLCILDGNGVKLGECVYAKGSFGQVAGSDTLSTDMNTCYLTLFSVPTINASVDTFFSVIAMPCNGGTQTDDGNLTFDATTSELVHTSSSDNEARIKLGLTHSKTDTSITVKFIIGTDTISTGEIITCMTCGTATVTPTTASLTADKSIIFNDLDQNISWDVGELLENRIEVTNTGDDNLVSIKVNDPKLGAVGTLELDVFPSPLFPGQTGLATFNYALTQADVDAGKFTNQATVTGVGQVTGLTATAVTNDPSTSIALDSTRVDSCLVPGFFNIERNNAPTQCPEVRSLYTSTMPTDSIKFQVFNGLGVLIQSGDIADSITYVKSSTLADFVDPSLRYTTIHTYYIGDCVYNSEQNFAPNSTENAACVGSLAAAGCSADSKLVDRTANWNGQTIADPCATSIVIRDFITDVTCGFTGGEATISMSYQAIGTTKGSVTRKVEFSEDNGVTWEVDTSYDTSLSSDSFDKSGNKYVSGNRIRATLAYNTEACPAGVEQVTIHIIP